MTDRDTDRRESNHVSSLVDGNHIWKFRGWLGKSWRDSRCVGGWSRTPWSGFSSGWTLICERGPRSGV